MIKKTLKYNDFDGNPVTEDFYFGLSKAELAEMALAEDGGFRDRLQALVDGGDAKKIMHEFKGIVAMTVGKRSADGKRFAKSDDISADFMQSNAYSELFMELVSNASFAADFMNGIMPSDMVEQVTKSSAPAFNLAKIDDNLKYAYIPEVEGKKIDVVELPEKDKEDYTNQELLEMPQSMFDKILGTNPNAMSRRHLVIAMQRRMSGKHVED